MLRALLIAFLSFTPFAMAAEAELPVPLRTIYPGEVLNAAQLAMRSFDLREGQESGFVRLPETVNGKVARRTLLANQPIAVQAVEEPRVALVGRQVRIDFIDGGLQISTFGSVLQAGGIGDAITVRVLDGGRVVSGIVQKDGSVRVRDGAS